MAAKLGHMELEAFVQATEDEAKVVLALSNLAGHDVKGSLETVRTEGIHKNPLVLLKVRFTKEREAREVLSNLLLSDSFRKVLQEGPGQRLDEDNVLHFRFDKQAAYNGTAVMHVSGEAVKLTIKVLTFPFSREAALECLKGLALTGDSEALGP